MKCIHGRLCHFQSNVGLVNINYHPDESSNLPKLARFKVYFPSFIGKSAAILVNWKQTSIL